MLVGLRTAQVAERFEEGLHGAIIGFPTASVNAADGPRIILPGTVCFPLSLHLPPWQIGRAHVCRPIRFEEGLHGAIIGFPTASVNAADGPRIILPGTVCFPLSLHLPPW